MKTSFILVYCDADGDRAARMTSCCANIDVNIKVIHIPSEEGLRAYCRSVEDRANDTCAGLVIMDITFFKTVGDGILHAIRAVPRLQFAPLIFLVDHPDQTQEVNAYAYGVNSFLVRRSTNEECVQMMKQCIAFWAKWNIRVP